MEMFHSIWTLLLMAIFVAIAIWAWSSHKRRDFDEASRIPLQDDDGTD